jgi:DNA polymerase gamma 1
LLYSPVTFRFLQIFNYGRIYGAGRRYAEKLLLQFNPNLSKEEAKQKSTLMYDTTKGKNINDKWVDGSESEMFNKLEEIAKSRYPKTPVLNASITKSLEPHNVNEDVSASKNF